jgi:hypothetical protein
VVVGNDVNDEGIAARIGSGGGAVLASARAGQDGAAGRDHPDGLGAAFSGAARIVRAHHRHHRRDPPLDQFGVGDGEPGPHRPDSGGIVAFAEP